MSTSTVRLDYRAARSSQRGPCRVSVSGQIVRYSFWFVAVACIAFFPLIVYGKGLINNTDGLRQQFGTFVDVGKTLREVLRGVVKGSGLHIPAYDLSMGYGSPRAWPYDPFMYLSVLCPTRLAEVAFNIVVLVKLWLCGVAVLPLAKELGASKRWGVVAGLAYAFSGEGLNCMLQTQYLNIMILFPLLVLGALRLLRGGSSRLYLLVGGALGIVSGWYALYMAELQIAVIAAVVLGARRSSPREWVSMLGRFLPAIAGSLAMCLPRLTSVLNIASLDRVSVSYEKPLLYSPTYYQRLLSGFTGVMFGERDWFFGFGALGLLGVLLLLLAMERSVLATALKVLLAIATVFVCVPFFGSLFNGMSYVANRWVYGYSLLVACVIGVVGTSRLPLTKARIVPVAIALLAYCVAVIALPDAIGIEARWQMLVAWGLLAVMISRDEMGLLDGGPYAALLAVLAALSLGTNYVMFIAPYGTNWQDELVPAGEAIDRTALKTPASLAEPFAEDKLVRTDRSVAMHSGVQTEGLLAHRILNTYGIDLYSSQYNNRVDRFHRDLALAESDMPNTYSSLDQRAALEELLGVGLYVTTREDGLPLPYGFSHDVTASLVTAEGTTCDLYLATRQRGIAHVLTHEMDEEDYRTLTPLQRQEALRQAVVLDGADGQSGWSFAPTSKEVPFTIEQVDAGIEVGDGYVDVREGGTSISLSLASYSPKSELYLYVRNLALHEDRGIWNFVISIDAGYSSGQVRIYTPFFHLYGGKDTWLWNVGYAKQAARRVTLTFAEPGRYTFSEFGVYAQPMKKDQMKLVDGVEWDTLADRLRCEVDATKEGELLLLTVPYDTGWSATVNGKEAELLLADTAFMAVRLPEGHCKVELAYRSQTKVFELLGFVATVVFVGDTVRRRKR